MLKEAPAPPRPFTANQWINLPPEQQLDGVTIEHIIYGHSRRRGERADEALTANYFYRCVAPIGQYNSKNTRKLSPSRPPGVRFYGRRGGPYDGLIWDVNDRFFRMESDAAIIPSTPPVMVSPPLAAGGVPATNAIVTIPPLPYRDSQQITLPRLAKLAGRILPVLSRLPEKPQATGDAATDVHNTLQYAGALFAFQRREKQVRLVAEGAASLLWERGLSLTAEQAINLAIQTLGAVQQLPAVPTIPAGADTKTLMQILNDYLAANAEAIKGVDNLQAITQTAVELRPHIS